MWKHPWDAIKEKQAPAARPGPLRKEAPPISRPGQTQGKEVKVDHAASTSRTDRKPGKQPDAHDELIPYQEAIRQALAVMAPMNDLQERAKHKEMVLKELMPWVDCWVVAGAKYPNPVAVRCMIWLFDIGHIERALPLALVLIGQKIQRLPDGFDRDMPTFVCDCVYDWAKERLQSAQSAFPHLERLIEAMERDNWDLHPIVKGKLYAMAAKHAMRKYEFSPDDEKDWAIVAAWCKKAEKANPRAGIKAISEKAYAALKASI